MVFTTKSPSAQGQYSPQGSSSNGCCLFRFDPGPFFMRLSFPSTGCGCQPCSKQAKIFSICLRSCLRNSQVGRWRDGFGRPVSRQPAQSSHPGGLNSTWCLLVGSCSSSSSSSSCSCRCRLLTNRRSYFLFFSAGEGGCCALLTNNILCTTTVINISSSLYS